MKIIVKYIIRPLIILLFIAVSFNAMAQAPPPPPGGGTGNGNGGGGSPGNSLNGAPIGNELIIFLLLGAAYGGKKIYDFKQKEVAEE